MRSDIYLSTSCLPSYDLDETLTAYEELDIEKVELGYCGGCRDIDSVVKSYDFEFIAHNYFLYMDDEFILNLASQEPSIRDASVEYVLRAVEFCDRHSIDTYSVHGGFRVDPSLSLEFPTENVPDYQQCLDTFVDSIRTIAEQVDAYDVELSVENNVVTEENAPDGEPLLLFAEHQDFHQFYQELASEEVGILLDTGHLKVSARTLGFELEQFVEELAEHIDVLHLHTNDGEVDQHKPPTSQEMELIDELDSVTPTLEAHFKTKTQLRNYIQSVFKDG